MNIAVLVKQVPSVSDIELDPKTNNLVRIGAPSMLNPVDLHAIEAALAVKDSVGGTVTLISMGMATAADAMRDGIAMGADKGVLVSDERMAGSDTLATGKILAKAIEKNRFRRSCLYRTSVYGRRYGTDSSGSGTAFGHVSFNLCRRSGSYG